jgi:hypothetical protein
MLNDTRIRNAKPRERDYKLTDFDGPYVLVRPNGGKLWRFAYRLNGKQKQIALGAYPELTPVEARDRREASRKLLANGKDPSLERRLEKIALAAGGNTFREVAEELLDKHRREERSEATLKKNRWLHEPAYVVFKTARRERSPHRSCCTPCGNLSSAAVTKAPAGCGP